MRSMAVVEDAVSWTDQPAAWACPLTRGANIRSSERKTMSIAIVSLVPGGTVGTEPHDGSVFQAAEPIQSETLGMTLANAV